MLMEFSTLAIHSDKGTSDDIDVAPPIHVSTTYSTGNTDGLVYSRAHTTTRNRLEKTLGVLEGGFACVYSSGLNAVVSIIFHMKPTMLFISALQGYFGVRDIISHFEKFISTYGSDSFKNIDLDNGELERIAKEIEKGNKKLKEEMEKERIMIWLETPKNPTCTLQDIVYFSSIAKILNAFLVVDSTIGSPVLQQPLKLGADCVLHSCSKFLGGHSDVLAGALITKTNELALELREARSTFGGVLGNFEGWLLLRSLRTVDLRINQQSQTAFELAEWLEKQIQKKRKVTKVWYPALKSSPFYEICQRQMGGKGGGLLSVELETIEDSLNLQKHLKLFRDATSFGGLESMIDYRYRWDKTVPHTLLRISIGLEGARDLINDFDNALNILTCLPTSSKL